MCIVAFCGHFTKRLYENHYVHIHRVEFKPIKDLIINCSYYQIFTFLIARNLLNGDTCIREIGVIKGVICALAWICFEYGNFSAHLALRRTKLQNGMEKAIPFPFSDLPLSKAFDWISCPNYTFEALSWFAFAVFADIWAAYAFAAAGFAIMASWAIEKHAHYNKHFRDYPTHRKAILPYIL